MLQDSAAVTGAERGMPDEHETRGRPAILSATLKTCLAIGFLSLCAANWLTHGFDTHGLSRLASAVSRDVPDPVSTGSLQRSAAAATLDPCAVPRRR